MEMVLLIRFGLVLTDASYDSVYGPPWTKVARLIAKTG
jgi:hypothetical protein